MTFKLRKTVNQRWKKSQTRKWANRLPRPIRYQFFLGGIKCLRLTQWTTRSLRYCLKLGYIREVEVLWRDRFYRRVFLWCWTAKRLHAKRILLSFVLFFFFIEFSNIFFKILTCMISWRVEKLKKKKRCAETWRRQYKQQPSQKSWYSRLRPRKLPRERSSQTCGTPTTM